MKDNSFPAFPCEGGDHSALHASYGMSIRDYFAGQIVIGLIVNSQGSPSNFARDSSRLAEISYLVADSMLKERERE
jgi:hypothetical protein